MKIALIRDGIVENIASWDGESGWEPSGFTAVDVTELPLVRIGDIYDGETFTTPEPEPPPEEVPTDG